MKCTLFGSSARLWVLINLLLRTLTFLPQIEHFTSKPIEPTPSTLKADLVAFVNSNVLITKIIGKSAQWLCVSSTSASKFAFLELPIDTGSTQFEAKSPCYIRLCCADINSCVRLLKHRVTGWRCLSVSSKHV